MRLDEYIEANIEPIMLQWVAFAGTLAPQGAGMDDHALRDHAKEILSKIVSDMRVEQSSAQQTAKSHDTPSNTASTGSAASRHARQRARHGFAIVQLAAEFRALRASVLRLWSQGDRVATHDELDQVTRFNEAVDEALADSLAVFSADVDQARSLFVGVLGHDMRGPLSTVLSCAQYSLRVRPDGARESQMILRSATQIKAMLDDLVEYTGRQLGVVTSLRPTPFLLDVFVREVVDEMAAIYPELPVELRMTGDLEGEWDIARLHRMLSNLLTNAQKYGARAQPVLIELDGRAQDSVGLMVHNTGTPVAPELLPHLFEPLTTSATKGGDGAQPAGANLGLGLYVVHEIVKAHGGSIGVTSSAAAGTRFEVRLPRRAGRS